MHEKMANACISLRYWEEESERGTDFCLPPGCRDFEEAMGVVRAFSSRMVEEGFHRFPIHKVDGNTIPNVAVLDDNDSMVSTLNSIHLADLVWDGNLAVDSHAVVVVEEVDKTHNGT